MSPLRSLALVVLLVAAVVRATCRTAADCFFGGVCNAAGACICRPEWAGANCSQLAFLPAAGSGAAFAQPRTSSSGGSVARVGETYWMAVAVMQGHCGLASWEANSAIVLASATTPEGPYAPVAGPPLVAPFAHNPTLHRTGNGSLVIAHIGQGVPYHKMITNCTNGTTPAQLQKQQRGGAAPALKLATVNATLPAPNFMYLPSGDPSDGSPWQALNSSGGGWADNNPALLIHDDDSTLLVYKTHCSCPGGCFCAQFGVATAPHWAGPYTDHGLINVFGEDAFIWRDPPGAPGAGYHMLFQGGSYAPEYPVYVGHFHTAASPDGLNWTVAADSQVFNGTIARLSGGPLELARRERHQVLLTASGTPAYLFNGAAAAGAFGDATFTAVQPIAQ
jgi:hypothetical protein